MALETARNADEHGSSRDEGSLEKIGGCGVGWRKMDIDGEVAGMGISS